MQDKEHILKKTYIQHAGPDVFKQQLKVHIFITLFFVYCGDKICTDKMIFKRLWITTDFTSVKVKQLSEGNISTIVPHGGATTKSMNFPPFLNFTVRSFSNMRGVFIF